MVYWRYKVKSQLPLRKQSSPTGPLLHSSPSRIHMHTEAAEYFQPHSWQKPSPILLQKGKRVRITSLIGRHNLIQSYSSSSMVFLLFPKPSPGCPIISPLILVYPLTNLLYKFSNFPPSVSTIYCSLCTPALQSHYTLTKIRCYNILFALCDYGFIGVGKLDDDVASCGKLRGFPASYIKHLAQCLGQCCYQFGQTIM